MATHKHFPRYSHRLLPFARRFRREMTEAERKVWLVLRGNQLGVKFRRQVPYGRYILDFFCNDLMLNIEIDGDQHYTDEGTRKDVDRDEELEEDGITVMRFSNEEVLKALDSVVERIDEVIRATKQGETPP